MGLSPDIGNMIADPNHIEQAIVNLMVKARDAMPLEKALDIIRKDTPRALDPRCFEALVGAVTNSTSGDLSPATVS